MRIRHVNNSFWPVIIMAFTLLSCSQNAQKNNAMPIKAKTDTIAQHKTQEVSEIEKEFLAAGLVNVQELDSTIKVDLKYASKDNFLKENIYGELHHAYLQQGVAEKLVNAQKCLHELHPGFSLLIYDAARPLYAQRVIWDSLKVALWEKSKYASNPKNGGSLHNYGAAVDLSIQDSTGKELDMGCPFDYFGELAYPVSEAKLLRSGELTQLQVNNRKLLTHIAGFDL
jgi:D-alanyl-D-alanine dipeptidase